MICLLRRFFHPNAACRRLMSGLCGGLLLFSLLFSGVFMAAESDHDCTGTNCTVCLQLHTCLDGLQPHVTPIAPDVLLVINPLPPDAQIATRDYHAPATTLQSLYVRMDE